MGSAGVLESIAEVAIALAGFGGVAAGLGYRARGTWSEDDRLRLILLAGVGGAVVFACFLPYAIHHLETTPPWRLSSLFFLPISVAFLAYVVWRVSPYPGGFPAGYSRIMAVVTVANQFAITFLLLVAAFGDVGTQLFGFYLSATLLTLFQAFLFFIRLLVTAFRATGPAA